MTLSEWNEKKGFRYLGCSRGCRFDTHQMWHSHLTPGDRCPDVISYDRMGSPPTVRCRRILKVVDEES